ncbi:MAG: hypothetical protein Q7R84_00235, partial [bacterium]|nr:hypothetical protein [bacterium]
MKKENFLPLSIVISALILGGSWAYTHGGIKQQASVGEALIDENSVIPQEGVELPVIWGNIGAQMVEKGVIDSTQFESLYSDRGGMDDEMKKILYGSDNGKIKMTPENAGFLLNAFWALGLGNKNPILENGPMSDPQYGGAGNFASTGGWTLSRGNAMNHYSMHAFMILSPEQQSLVERVSKGIYRPCCGNSVHFPDCNHGMAMLGLLELMASQGMNEADIWKAALAVNSYWFPDTYLTIAMYVKNNGVDWKNVNPQEVLGINYSSAQGYARVASQVVRPQQQGGGSG